MLFFKNDNCFFLAKSIAIRDFPTYFSCEYCRFAFKNCIVITNQKNIPNVFVECYDPVGVPMIGSTYCGYIMEWRGKPEISGPLSITNESSLDRKDHWVSLSGAERSAGITESHWAAPSAQEVEDGSGNIYRSSKSSLMETSCSTQIIRSQLSLQPTLRSYLDTLPFHFAALFIEPLRTFSDKTPVTVRRITLEKRSSNIEIIFVFRRF